MTETQELLNKFFQEVEKVFTPLSDLPKNKRFQIIFTEKREMKYGETLLATLSNETTVIIPQRFNKAFIPAIMERINDGSAVMFLEYFGTIDKKGKQCHLVEFHAAEEKN